MKIEKISDNQIKCTLNRSDLMNYKLQISELAYGTDNAKALFQELMDEAFEKFGFESDNIPLMIEAVPVSPDCIILLVTKITSASDLTEQTLLNDDSAELENMDDLYDDLNSLFPLLDDYPDTSSSNSGHNEQINSNKPQVILCIYDFLSLDHVMKACRALNDIDTYVIKSSVYKTTDYGIYYLILHIIGNEKDYNQITGIVTEYGEECANASSIEAYLEEHSTILIPDEAIAKLSYIENEK